MSKRSMYIYSHNCIKLLYVCMLQVEGMAFPDMKTKEVFLVMYWMVCYIQLCKELRPHGTPTAS